MNLKLRFSYLFRERICSPKEFAPLRMLSLLLKGFAPLRIFCRFVSTQKKIVYSFRTYRGKRMSVNVLAIAGNFFLFIKIPGRFQVVYGTVWIELFLACHRTFGIYLFRAGI